VTLLPFLIIGLTSGAVYALAGVGLVLTYKTSGVFNFAHAALAAVAAYVFYTLFVLNGWPWPLAATVAIALVGPIMGLGFELLARRIHRSAQALRIAATVGVFLAVEAAIYLIYGTETIRTVPVFLGAGLVRVAGANVQMAQLVTFGFAVAATLALTAYLHRTRPGMAMRAVVDDPELLDITGTSQVATRRTAWAIGATFAAASGVLFTPLLPLDPVQLTLLVASAFGAAAVGAFTSLPLTFAGGLAIGVLSALCTKWFTGGALLGFSPAVPFLVVLVVVLFFPRHRHLSWSGSVIQAAPMPKPSWLGFTGAAALLAVLLLVPLVAGVHLTDWTTFVATSIVLMSLGLLVRVAGQVVLCQVTFAAIGAAAFSHLALGGLPWLVALVLACLIAVPVGLVLAVPASRMSPVYLALATFAFGIVVQESFYPASYMFGATGLGLNEPMPALSWSPIGGARGFYYVALAIASIAALLVVALTHGRFGRLLRAADEAPIALQTSGADIRVTRTILFAVAAFLAALGGVLAGVGQETVVGDSYQPLVSLTYVAAIVIVPGGPLASGVLAAAGLVLIPSYLPGFHTGTVLQLVFGVSVTVYALLPPQARGAPRFVQRVSGRLPGRGAVEASVVPDGRGSARRLTGIPEPGVIARLSLDDITVRIGNADVLSRVSMIAQTRRVTGLIGPNGAGKTSVINVCSGLLRPGQGQLRLGELDLLRCQPATRARLGVRRTFQHPQLFQSLTLRENVEAGAEACLAGRRPLRHVRGRHGDRSAIRRVSDCAIELCGLAPYADVPVVELSPGERRLAELARCLTGPCRLLLLDEPCSGVDQVETRRIGQVLRQIVSERGVGILLVEHDLSFALDVCEHVYVLDLGRVIFEGPPEELISSDLVRATYMGTAAVGEAARDCDLTARLLDGC
jgi:ABC-type branched-subunit amino acid transport system ATPase component/branched-subunit amino acid ABC-type transport system permease component